MIECMFDTLELGPAAFSDADDAAVVAAIEDWARIEAAAGARRLAAIAELVSRRCDKPDERAHWACDFWDFAGAEVAAALGVNHSKASGQMQLSLTLRHRLPKLAALFIDGKVSYRVVSAIAWQTQLVVDDEPAALIDTALAERATTWGRLSDYKLAQAIDLWVDLYDPGALRRIRGRARTRDLEVGDRDDKSDTTSVWGRLYATDAAVLHRRLMEMAHGVCDDDPRTIAQRRADALGALAAGADRLACSCGSPQCSSGDNDGRASNVVIHVVTEASALHAQPDALMNGDDREPEPEPPPDAPAKPPAGLILSGGIVPTPLLAELIGSGATVRQIRRPGDTPESGYRPSTALEEFIRVRDLTCRFPGCEQSAEFCDIDHTIAYPAGPTHASNLKCLCRKHHLLKTFWTGTGGWADRQLPDGTVIWKSPTGKTYKTRPGSRIFFPAWNTTTAELPQPSAPVAQPSNRAVMMPKRQHTRATERTRRIHEERALNDTHVAERNRPPPF
jgi:Domain of unknown function (DUF222)